MNDKQSARMFLRTVWAILLICQACTLTNVTSPTYTDVTRNHQEKEKERHIFFEVEKNPTSSDPQLTVAVKYRISGISTYERKYVGARRLTTLGHGALWTVSGAVGYLGYLQYEKGRVVLGRDIAALAAAGLFVSYKVAERGVIRWERMIDQSYSRLEPASDVGIDVRSRKLVSTVYADKRGIVSLDVQRLIPSNWKKGPIEIKFSYKGTGRFTSSDLTVTVPQDLIEGFALSDVDVNIPATRRINRDAIAVVIGNQHYRSPDIPHVDYAINDARTMKEYLINTFGYREGNIIYKTDATQGTLNSIFGTESQKGKLSNLVKKSRSDVFVYYSGHGAPDIETKRAYFVPVDCDPAYVSTNGYSLDLFYKNLNALDVRNMTVVIDACFSGISAEGTLIKNISAITPVINEKAMLASKGTIFTSVRGDQVSSWYPQKKHSLFTYYFLKALQGHGDQNRDGRLTIDEIRKFITDEVPYRARLIANREQNPQVHARDRNAVLVKY